MKLLYVSHDVSDLHINLLNKMIDNNIDCFLFSFGCKDTKNLILNKLKCSIYNFSIKFTGPFFFIKKLKKTYQHFSNIVSNKHIDIIHANMMFSDGYVARMLSKEFNIPYILSIRNTDINLKFLWLLPWIKKEGIYNLLDAKYIVFLSKSYKEKLFKHIPISVKKTIESKTVIIPNGIDDFWYKNIYHNKNIQKSVSINLITVGRIEYNKNQLNVAKALQSIQKKMKYNFHYTIVGTVVNEKIYSKLKKYKFITFVNHKNKEELIKIYRTNDIYIMPSFKETFGLVYVEAMTQGLPIIYSKGEGFDNQFVNGLVGCSVNSTDVCSIENGIMNVVNNYEYMSFNCIKCCYDFTLQNIVNRLLILYKNNDKY